MKVQNSLLVLGLALFPALPVLVQCAHGDDQEDQEDDEDLAGEDESAGDEANAQENATEEASDEEPSPAEDTAAEPEPAAEGGGDDFAAMLAAMQEQQKKAGVEMPANKTTTNKKSSSQPTTTVAAAAATTGPQPMWVFVEKAWIFSTPATTGTKVKTLKYGDKVEVAAAEDGWVRLSDNQYVRAKDLTDRKSKFGSKVLNQTLGQSGPKGGHKVKSETLAVRNAPNLTAKVIGYRKQNDTVAVLKDEQGWSQIGPGQFVRSKYLYSGAEPAIGTGDQVFVVKTQSLYIRTKPDLESSVVGVVLEGNKVRVSETKDGWSRIGPNRFIRSKHLEPLAH